MKDHLLPPGTQAQYDQILAKLLSILETASEHTKARSEFMNYDGSTGGQVLDSNPPIEHPYQELADAYLGILEQAKQEGLELREMETLFERASVDRPWTHRMRFLSVGEFEAFTEKVSPAAEEIGAILRKVGADTAPDWYNASFNPGPEEPRCIVLHGQRVRVVKEPTPELNEVAARVRQAASEEGLELIAADWEVSSDDEEEVEWVVRVGRAWPASL